MILNYARPRPQPLICVNGPGLIERADGATNFKLTGL